MEMQEAMEEVSFKYRNKRVALKVRRVDFLGRIVGLMFTFRKRAEPLLFEFKKPTKISIHSLFVFFPFFAVWIDKKNKIVDVKRVKPFTFSVCPKKDFIKLIEIPVGIKHSRIL